jgi:hypothetical protein
MDTFEESGTSEAFGTASVPTRSSPGMGASNTFAAVIPQSMPAVSPEAGIGAPNQDSSAAPAENNAPANTSAILNLTIVIMI